MVKFAKERPFLQSGLEANCCKKKGRPKDKKLFQEKKERNYYVCILVEKERLKE